jgi:hypothetical protein
VASRVEERRRCRQTLVARTGAFNELRQWFHANPQSWRMFRKRYLKELVNERLRRRWKSFIIWRKASGASRCCMPREMEEYNNATVLKELLEGMPKPPSSVGRAAAQRERIRKSK